MKICGHPGCERKYHARGYCGMHLQRFIRGLAMDAPRRYPDGTVEDRFWAKVDKNGPLGCWVWTASTYPSGYGAFGVAPGKVNCAHRFAYELLVGPIPEGLQLDHLCRTRLCVNPVHLEPVTIAENVLRGIGPSATNARKTHCIHGHPFDEANTKIDREGFRHCRACSRKSTAVAS